MTEFDINDVPISTQHLSCHPRESGDLEIGLTLWRESGLIEAALSNGDLNGKAISGVCKFYLR